MFSYSSSSFLACLLLSSSYFWRTVNADCNATCDDNKAGATCSTALGLVLVGNVSEAMAVLEYGHYCGATVTTCEDPTVDAGCDAVDDACREHDICLDAVMAADPNATMAE